MNSKGFSLLEVVIVIGVMAIATLGIGTMMTQMFKTLNYAQDKISLGNLETHLVRLANSPESCNNSFGGKNLAALPTAVHFRDHNNNVFLNSGARREYDNLVVKQITLEQDLPAATAANGGGFLKITTVMERKSIGGGPQQLKPIEIPIRVTANSAGVITRCGSAASKMLLLSSPQTLPTLSLPYVSGSPWPCGTRRNNTVSLTNVPNNATHAIVRTIGNMNIGSGNVLATIHLGARSSTLVKVIHMDGSSGSTTETQGHSTYNVPLRSTGTNTATFYSRLDSSCGGSGTIATIRDAQGWLTLDGYMVSE